MKKGIIICLFFTLILLLQSNVKRVTSSNFPPTNCTGAPNTFTCAWCHSNYLENMDGGGISLIGIPTTFSANQTYPFSINIKHFSSDRRKFGYDVTALDALGNPFGTFSTNNTNSTIERSTGELTSHDPLLLTVTNQSTINGFVWNSPKTTPTKEQLPITFYFCGNACNGDGTVKGDYVYNDSLATTFGTLPVLIERFAAIRNSDERVQLSWSFPNVSILRNFIIQKSVNGSIFFDLDSLLIKSCTSINNNKYTYIDTKLSENETISYRIKLIAIDGSFSYSAIKLVNPIINFIDSKLYPNPISCNHDLIFNFKSSQNVEGKMAVISSSGKICFTQKIQVTSGSNSFSIPINSNFNKGTYFLIVSISNNTIQKQLFMVI